MAHRIGIIGLGKIAQDQHIPVIRANPASSSSPFRASAAFRVDGVPHAFSDHREMLALADLDAVAICRRRRCATRSPAAMEGASTSCSRSRPRDAEELEDLRRRGERAGTVVFTAWHSQYNRAVDEARRAPRASA